MTIIVNGQPYRLSFYHRNIGGIANGPTIHDLASTLALAKMKLSGQLTAQAEAELGIDVGDTISGVLESYLRSLQPLSFQSECYLRDFATNELITSGAALCDKRDQFEYAVGRAIAYAKAVSAFPPAQHDDFCAAYVAAGIKLREGARVNMLHAVLGKEYEHVAIRLIDAFYCAEHNSARAAA